MGLFFSSDRFTRPGPGVRPDAPRKRVLPAWPKLWAAICGTFPRRFPGFPGLPAFHYRYVFAVETHALLFMLLAGIIGA